MMCRFRVLEKRLINLWSQVYVVGGYDGHTYHSSVERYDPVTDSWCTVEPMCIRRRGVAVAVAG